MKNVGTPWLLALCAAAAIGCGGSSPTEQVVTGRVTTRGAVAVRAISGTKIVTAARVRTDGSFTLALPAGSTYRLDLLTTGGVKHVLERNGSSFTDLTFDVCQPGSPWNLGTVDDGAGTGSGSGSGSGGGVPPVPCEVLPDGTTDCPPPPPPCDPSTGQNCPPPCGSNGLECPCEVNPDGTTTCPPPPPPPPCDPATDPTCPCQTGPDGTTTCPPPPPPPPCDPATDPACPCVVNPDGTTNCPQPPPCPLNPDGTPNCPQPCDASTDPTCPTPPPPCTDPSDPNTCQDPCMTDPSQCGCAVPVAGTSGSGTSTGGASGGGTASCWPPPQPPQCDSAGNCDPTGVAPQFPPGNFGCHGAGL